MKGDICPIDGQTREWHLKLYSVKSANPRAEDVVLFGDRLGCGFIEGYDRVAVIRQLKEIQDDEIITGASWWDKILPRHQSRGGWRTWLEERARRDVFPRSFD